MILTSNRARHWGTSSATGSSPRPSWTDLHHAITLNIRGNSYRLKDKLKPARPARGHVVNPGWGIFNDRG